jgi:hypothetical protein
MEKVMHRFWLIALLALPACGGDPDVSRESEGSVVVKLRPGDGLPAWGEVPFPSDLYREESGDVGAVPGLERLATTGLDAVLEGLSALDGFGRSTGIAFCLEGSVDEASLATEDGVTPGIAIVDIDPGSPSRGRVVGASARFYPTLGCVGALGLPGHVLRAGTLHAAIVTREIRGSDGLPVAADAELARIRGLAPDERTTRAEKLYGDALDALVEVGAVTDEREVRGLSVFTTSSQASELAELAERLRAEPAQPELLLEPAAAAPFTAIVFGTASSPSLGDWLGAPEKDETGREWPGFDNPGGIAHDAIGAIASGAFEATSFLDPTTGRFERDATGAIKVGDPAVKIPVTIVIPKSPAPPSGYPVIVNGHGLSNNRGSMLAVANEFARAGFVTIGIDDVLHGLRAGVADTDNNYAGSYQGPDGIPDEMTVPLTFFAGLSDFLRIRDNLRQTVLDQVSLVRLVQSSALDLAPLGVAAGAAPPKLDPTRIHWNGGSLGGIIGSMTIAVEPAIQRAVLEVPGGGFAHLVTTGSAKMSGLIGGIIKSSFGVVGEERLDEHHPFVNLLSPTMEAGDPLAYAPHVLSDRLVAGEAPEVLVTYTHGDEVLPNIATFALLRALGLSVVGTRLDEQPAIGVVEAPLSGNGAVEYAPATHGLGYARFEPREYQPGVPISDPENPFPKLDKPFELEMPIREHCDQIVHFLETGEIVVTAPPVRDYDGDGVLDADEQAAGTDPLDPNSH